MKRKIQKFIIEHPKIERRMDILFQINNIMLMVHIIIFVSIVLLGCLIVYYALPIGVRDETTPVIAVLFSVILAPFLMTSYSKTKEKEVKRFEINRLLYVDLLEVLIPLISVEEEYSNHIDKLEKYIKNNYSQMFLSFKSHLIDDILSVWRSCENDSYENVKYYGKKCIRRIRRECGMNGEILIPLNLKDILLKKSISMKKEF